jgi:hypothetical protein
MLMGIAPAARLASHKLQLQHDRSNNSADEALSSTGICLSGQKHCCCEIGDVDVSTVKCKYFMTGMIDGKEACKCGDSIVKKKLGMTGHSPNSWRKSVFRYFPRLSTATNLGGMDIEPFYSKMDELCSAGAVNGQGAFVLSFPEFKGEMPTCTDERLFALAAKKDAKAEVKHPCINQAANRTSRNQGKLEGSTLLKSFNSKITADALMGCANIGLGCDAKSWKSTFISTAIDNIESNLVGEMLKGNIMKQAQQMLQIESGISAEVAKELLDWAFYHEEGTNPYCDPATLEDRRDLLVRGLTAEDADHVVLDLPWKYGDEVFGPIKALLRGTIDGMFAADCEKPEPLATAAEAKAGKGVSVTLSEEELQTKIEAK